MLISVGFLIVPFDVTIPPEEQIKDLHSRIIETSLPEYSIGCFADF